MGGDCQEACCALRFCLHFKGGTGFHITLVTSAFLHPEQADFPGTRRYTTELAKALSSHGATVRVVVPRANEDLDGINDGNPEVVGLDGLRSTVGRASGIAQLNTLYFARQFVRTPWLVRETDIVHSTVPLLGIDEVRRHHPVVAFAHHVERPRSLGDLLTVPFGNAYGAYTYRRADAVVVPSKATADQLARRLNADPARVNVIHHGVNQETFSEIGSRDNGDSNGPIVLFVGSMHPRKNLNLILDAFGLLLKSVPNAQLVLVGSGPLDQQIERRTKSLQANGRVIRLSQLTDRRLCRMYSNARVFVTASHDEGFGFAAVESMASGTPVVALDIPVNREIIGDAGLLIREKDPAALSAAINGVLEDPQFASKLSARGRRRVKELFSWQVAAKKYLLLYGNLIERRLAG